MIVVVRLKGNGELIKIEDVELIDPIGLPGFISIVRHNPEDADRHTSFVWPSASIDNMIIETVEGEKFEHTDTPRWFKQM